MDALVALVIGSLLSASALIATELYCHRSLAHRSVEFRRPVRLLLDVTYRALVGTDPRVWAIVHRRHHRFADRPGDPHSPSEHGVLRVWLLSGVLFRRARPRSVPPAPVLTAAARLVRIALVAGLLPHFPPSTLALAVAVHVAVYLLIVGAINSLGHSVGRRPHPEAAGTNIPWLSLPLFGQSYQNNHHHAPGRARMGPFDPLYPVLVSLVALQLAWLRER